MASFLKNSALAGAILLVAQAGDLTAQRAPRDQTIFISVADKDGKPPASLAIIDLSVREDGNVREVLKVEPSTTPLQIAVLIDTSQASQGSIPDLRDAVKVFGQTIWARSPDTQIALYAFGERPSLEADYTNNATALGRGVDRLFAGSGAGAYFIEAVVDSATGLAKRKPARGAVVAYVDENGPEFSNRRHDQAFEALASARASLWTIARQGFGNNPMSSEARERATILGDVTQRTGGRSTLIFAPSALKDRFRDVAEQLLGQFAVTYGRPESLIPPERLEVRLSRAGYKLTAPRWTNK